MCGKLAAPAHRGVIEVACRRLGPAPVREFAAPRPWGEAAAPT
ncbi:hypothetical protein [Embleya hyalina]|nr:hypothetical protein [Embleya hyalina]